MIILTTYCCSFMKKRLFAMLMTSSNLESLYILDEDDLA